MSHQVIDREVDGVLVDASRDGRIELRIGKPMKERFEATRLAMEDAMSGEARILAHELLAAAERASAVSAGEPCFDRKGNNGGHR